MLGDAAMRILAISTLSVLVAACSVAGGDEAEQSESNVYGGRAEAGYAPVGYVLTLDQSCTGTLIAPDRVLTAAHCPMYGEFLLHSAPFKVSERVKIKRGYKHPLYATPKGLDVSVENNLHDIAVLTLERPITSVPLARLASASPGNGYRVVGYGTPARNEPSGTRKSIAYGIDKIGSMRVEGLPTERGTVCFGDSGGPLFKERTLEIVGTTEGMMNDIPYCVEGARIGFTNVDTHRGFLDDALACALPDIGGSLPVPCQDAIQHDASADPNVSFPYATKGELGRVAGQEGPTLETARVVIAAGNTTCVHTGYVWRCAGDNAHDQITGIVAPASRGAVLPVFAELDEDVDIGALGDATVATRRGTTFRFAGALALGKLAGGHREATVPWGRSGTIGEQAAYMLTDIGALYGIGTNIAETGQTSPTSFVQVHDPKATAPSRSVVSVRSGYDHTCFATRESSDSKNGRVSCFGANESGEVAGGAASVARRTRTDVVLPAGANPYTVGVGEGFSCAEGGGVYCWGKLPWRTTPIAPTRIADATQDFAVGRAHVCWIDDASRKILCRGKNDVGQLGDGTFVDRFDGPVEVKLPLPADMAAAGAALAAGERHTCALVAVGRARSDHQTDAEVFCWGANDKGQLGVGLPSMTRANVPIRALQD